MWAVTTPLSEALYLQPHWTGLQQLCRETFAAGRFQESSLRSSNFWFLGSPNLQLLAGDGTPQHGLLAPPLYRSVCPPEFKQHINKLNILQCNYVSLWCFVPKDHKQLSRRQFVFDSLDTSHFILTNMLLLKVLIEFFRVPGGNTESALHISRKEL